MSISTPTFSYFHLGEERRFSRSAHARLNAALLPDFAALRADQGYVARVHQLGLNVNTVFPQLYYDLDSQGGLIRRMELWVTDPRSGIELPRPVQVAGDLARIFDNIIRKFRHHQAAQNQMVTPYGQPTLLPNSTPYGTPPLAQPYGYAPHQPAHAQPYPQPAYPQPQTQPHAQPYAHSHPSPLIPPYDLNDPQDSTPASNYPGQEPLVLPRVIRHHIPPRRPNEIPGDDDTPQPRSNITVPYPKFPSPSPSPHSSVSSSDDDDGDVPQAEAVRASPSSHELHSPRPLDDVGRVRDLTSEIETLRKQLYENQTDQRELRHLRELNNELQRGKQATLRELATIKGLANRLSNNIRYLLAERDHYHQKARELEERSNRLGEYIEELEGQVTAITDRLRNSHSERDQLRNELQRLRDLIASAQQERARRDQEQIRMQGHATHREERLTNYMRENLRLKAELERLTESEQQAHLRELAQVAKVEELERALKNLNAQARQKIDELRGVLERFAGEKNALQETVQKQKVELEDRRSRISELEGQLKAANGRNGELERALKQNQSELDDLRQNLLAHERALREKDTEIDRLKGRIRLVDAFYQNELRQQKHRYQKQFTELMSRQNRQVEELHEQIRLLETQSNASLQQASHAESQLKAQAETLHKLRVERDTLSQLIKRKGTEHRAEVRALKTQLREFKVMHQQASAAFQKAIERAKTATSRLVNHFELEKLAMKKVHQETLTRLKDAHERQLQAIREEMQALQRRAREQFERDAREISDLQERERGLQQANREISGQLQQLNRDFLREREEHAAALAAAEGRTARISKQLDAARAEHAQEIEAHQAKYQKLRERSQQLEEERNETRVYAERVSKTLAAVSETYRAHVGRLREELTEVRNHTKQKLREAREGFQKAVLALSSEAERRIEALKNAHERQLQGVREEMQALQRRAREQSERDAREISDLQERERNLQQANREISGQLQQLNRDFLREREEHAAALAAAEGRTALIRKQLDTALAKHAQEIEARQAKYQELRERSQQLEEERNEARVYAEKVSKTLEAVSQTYRAHVGRLLEELTEVRNHTKQKLREAREGFQKAVSALSSEAERRIEALKNAHARNLAELERAHEQAQRQNEESWNAEREQYEEQLTLLKGTNTRKDQTILDLQRRMTSREAQHANQSRELAQKFRVECEQLQKKHADYIESLELRHDEALEALEAKKNHEITVLRSKQKEFEATLSRQSEELRVLRQKTVELEGLRSTQEQRMKELALVMQAHQTAQNEAQAGWNQREQEFQGAISKMQGALRASEEEVRRLRQLNSDQAEQIGSLQGRVEVAEKLASERETQLIAKNSAIRLLEKRAADAEGRESGLEQQVQALKGRLQTVKTERDTRLHKEVRRLQEQLDAMRQQKEEATTALREARGEILVIQRQNEDYRRQVDLSKFVISRLQKENRTLQLRRGMDALHANARLRQVRREAARREAQLSQFHAQEVDVMRKVDSEARSVMAQKHYQKFEQFRQQAYAVREEDRASYRKEIQRLTDEIHRQRGKISGISSKNIDQRKAIGRLDAELETVQKQLEDLGARNFQGLRNKIQGFRDRITEQRLKISRLTTGVSELTERNRHLEEENQELESTRTRLREAERSVADKVNIIHEKNQKLSSLRYALNQEARATIELQRRKIEEREEWLREHEKRNAALEASLDQLREQQTVLATAVQEQAQRADHAEKRSESLQADRTSALAAMSVGDFQPMTFSEAAEQITHHAGSIMQENQQLQEAVETQNAVLQRLSRVMPPVATSADASTALDRVRAFTTQLERERAREAARRRMAEEVRRQREIQAKQASESPAPATAQAIQIGMQLVDKSVSGSSAASPGDIRNALNTPELRRFARANRNVFNMIPRRGDSGLLVDEGGMHVSMHPDTPSPRYKNKSFTVPHGARTVHRSMQPFYKNSQDMFQSLTYKMMHEIRGELAKRSCHFKMNTRNDTKYVNHLQYLNGKLQQCLNAFAENLQKAKADGHLTDEVTIGQFFGPIARNLAKALLTYQYFLTDLIAYDYYRVHQLKQPSILLVQIGTSVLNIENLKGKVDAAIRYYRELFNKVDLSEP